MGIRNWYRVATAWKEWRRIVLEAKFKTDCSAWGGERGGGKEKEEVEEEVEERRAWFFPIFSMFKTRLFTDKLSFPVSSPYSFLLCTFQHILSDSCCILMSPRCAVVVVSIYSCGWGAVGFRICVPSFLITWVYFTFSSSYYIPTFLNYVSKL